MNDLPPFEQRTPEIVRGWYHAEFPLLAAADRVAVEFNHADSVHEPVDGLDNREIARRALILAGLPPRCQADIDFAAAYISRLHAEMVDQYPPPQPNLADAVIAAEYTWADRVLTAVEFAELSSDAREEHAHGIADTIFDRESPDRMAVIFRQAIQLALPAVYAEITSGDEAHRRRRDFGIVPPAA